MDKAIQLAQAATPSSYLPVIALYMKNFGGGDNFPVLVFLQAVQKLFGHSLKLGEEFMSAVAQAEFKSKDSTYPIVRAALIASNLSSPKHQNGIAKLLVKSDIDKGKSPLQRNVLDLTEKLLRLAWPLTPCTKQIPALKTRTMSSIWPNCAFVFRNHHLVLALQMLL